MRQTCWVAILVFALPASGRPSEPALEARFRDEAPRAWEALDQFSKSLSGTIDVLIKGEGLPGPGEPGGQGKRERYRFLRNGNWTLSEARTELYLSGATPTQVLEGVRGMNSRYGFSLSRADHSDKWVLSNVIPARPTREDEYLVFPKFVIAHLRRGHLSPETLVDFLRHRNLRIRDVSTESRDGKELARVKFVIDGSAPSGVPPDPRLPKEAGQPGAFTLNCEWLLDPSRFWVMLESRTERTGEVPSKRLEKMDYEHLDGFPVLRRLEVRSWQPPSPGWGVNTAEFKDLSIRKVPEYEFSVTAYGLPEIDPAIKRPWPIWIWCLILAAGAGLLAFATRWYARRRAAA